jgi:hypothetical protein
VEITISSVAARARVHRSFIHRHPDLRAAVIAAAEDPAANGPAGASAVSRRSLQADNANLRDRARRIEQYARSLEDRLSELLGTQISQRTGLGPPPDIAALKDQVQALQQENLDLRRRAEERDEELPERPVHPIPVMPPRRPPRSRHARLNDGLPAAAQQRLSAAAPTILTCASQETAAFRSSWSR